MRNEGDIVDLVQVSFWRAPVPSVGRKVIFFML
jgi:hypothetical protein